MQRHLNNFMKRFLIAALTLFPLVGTIPATAANVNNMLCDDHLCIDLTSRKDITVNDPYAPYNQVTVIDTYTPRGKFSSTLEVDCGSVQWSETEDGGIDRIVNVRPHDRSEIKWYGELNGIIQEACADQD